MTTPKYSDVVSYATMDPFKVMAQQIAARTDGSIADTDYRVVPWSRGESVFLLEGHDHYLAHTEEGLGTLNAIPEAVTSYLDQLRLRQSDEQRLWEAIGQTNAAMIFNDMGSLGARLLSAALHVAAGHGDWFKHEARTVGLFNGWQLACLLAKGVWGGGESSTLRDVVMPGSAVLGGSAVGLIKPKERVIRPSVQAGDRIILVHSSGVHSNGITLIRDLLPLVGLKARLPSGQLFVEALLQPTPIYVAAIQALLDAGIDIHYWSNITGHGWRKIMRAAMTEGLLYVIEHLPPSLEVFEFLQAETGMTNEDIYSDYNMSAGAAAMVAPDQVQHASDVLTQAGFRNTIAGHVEAGEEGTAVQIRPLNITFQADTLQVR